MSNALQLADLSPLGSLEAYYRYVNQIPLLTAEEEYELANQLQTENDLSAARRLILAHLRYVVKVAHKFDGYGLMMADLIQEGNIGLMKAVRRFDPNMGVRLVSFAIHWIKSEIHEFIIKNWRIVKIATTKAQRKLFFNLRQATKKLSWLTQDEMTQIAEDLNVSVADVKEMEIRLRGSDNAMEHHALNDDEENFAPIHYLEAPHHYDPSEQHEMLQQENRYHQVKEALAQLNARDQEIVYRRWINDEKATLQELAAEYKISAERVRQIEESAIKKLKKLLTE